MTNFLSRWRDSPMPYQVWKPFPDDAIVQVKGLNGFSNIGLAKDFWWGYEEELGDIGEGVILKARRLDRPKGKQK